MMMGINVLGARLLYRVVSKFYNTLIIAQKWYLFYNYIIV
jgi:hypothetical protein